MFLVERVTHKDSRQGAKNAKGAKVLKPGAGFIKRAGYCLVLALTVSFLLAGCSLDDNKHEDTGFIPIGEWEDGFGGSYTISENELEFDDGYGFDQFIGTIEAAVDFSSNSGVLIIKIASSDTGITAGNYIGVYYKDLKSSHVFMANAVDESYSIIEVSNLNNAKSTFTVDTVSTHVTHWGSGYTK